MANRSSNLVKQFSGSLAPALCLSVLSIGTAVAACQGPGAPTNTQTKCLTAIPLPFPISSFDISFVNPDRGEYYLGDRSSKAVDVIDTNRLVYVRSVGTDKPFTGNVLNAAGTAVNNASAGPAGVVARGRWLYAGDGNSTLHVIDLDDASSSPTKQVISTGGKFRLDEMALTSDGTLLIAANNADDPPFVTLFTANGDAPTSNVSVITKILIDNNIVPSGFGLGIEQPAWDPKTQRFYTSVPIMANNPPGCNYGQLSGATTCSGGLLVTDPTNPTASQGAYDPVKNVGVLPLNSCGPNGATMGPNGNIMLGCTPGNFPAGVTTLVLNTRTKNYTNLSGLWASDEVWYNSGDNRYYTGSSGQPVKAGVTTTSRGSVFGVIDGSSVLIESIPVSSGTHSIAADSKRNLIFVPMIQTTGPTAIPVGDQNFTGAVNASPTVSQLTCGTSNGCIAVYKSGQNSDSDSPYQGTPSAQIVDNNTGSNTALTVGDTFTFTIAGAPPFSLVHVSETSSILGVSVPIYTADVGYTDANGAFSLTGAVTTSLIGTFQQTWTAGGVPVQPSPLTFSVSK